MVTLAQNIPELAKARNEQQHSRLEMIKENTQRIQNVLDNTSNFVDSSLMKQSAVKAIVRIKKELDTLLTEATNHIMWIKGLRNNDVSEDEVVAMLQYLEPETDDVVLSAREVLNKFTRTQK